MAYETALRDNPAAKRPRLMGSKHYDKHGKPYQPAFLDGYEPEGYPDEAEDVQWLIEGGLT